MTEVAIVVPCYNEADRLQCETFVEFVRQYQNITFIFVNDGSTDRTDQLLEKLIARDQCRFKLIELAKNRGKAETVRQGILNAISAGAKYVGYWDADLATPLSAIPDFLEELKRKTDLLLVMGARVQMLGRKIVRENYRHYLGRVFATLVSIILRLSVYDTQCGAKLFVANQPVALAFKEPFISQWVFDVEIIARLRFESGVNAERSIYEYPLLEWQDVRGSKVGLKDFWVALWDLARIYFRYVRA